MCSSRFVQIHSLFFISVAIFISLTLLRFSVSAQEKLLWGSLKPGPHAVGFRMVYGLDHSREYDPDFSMDRTQLPVASPRPILICIWYPSQKTSSKSLTYGQYLEIPTGNGQIAEYAERLTPHMREVVAEETIGNVPVKMTPEESKAFERLLSTKTFAVKNAPAAKGRFPVIVYHPGLNGTYEDNSVLFEYLASHGYVVLSSAYSDPDAYFVGITSDLIGSFRDLDFLVNYAHTLPYADADRLGSMGHSYGAWGSFAWVSQPRSPVRALVTLDSGLEYDTVETSGADELVTQMKLNKDNLRAASLRFASSERDPHFEYLDPYIKFAPRYNAVVSSLKHNDYLTHGAIRPELMPEKWPDPKRERRSSYDRLCEHVLNFMDATLKERVEAREFLQRSLRGENLDSRFSLQFNAPIASPPTVRQVARYLKQYGAEKGAELLSNYPDIAEGRLKGAAMVLLNDNDVKTAFPHLILIEKKYPQSAAIQAMLGKVRALSGDKTGAEKAFRNALRLLPDDATIDVLRRYWQNQIEGGLHDLGFPEK